MKIGIDVNPLIFSSVWKTGIEYYRYNLLKNLVLVDKDNQYLFYGYMWNNYRSRIEKIDFLLPLPENFYLRVKRIPTKLMRLLRRWKVPMEYLYGKIDIFHILRPDAFCFKYSKNVITVHDLSFEICPQWHTMENEARKRFYSLAHKADRIIAISENTKRDLVKLYNISPEKVKVIYSGVSKVYRPLEDMMALREFLKKFHLSNKFILFVGTIEPRKNLVRLIKTYYLLKEKGEIEHKLVIVGKKGWLYEEVFKAIEDLNLKKDIIFTGHLNEEDLVFLYNAANLFIYPSLYEGFGLPPLEAMACGVPVITSNISSLPEVVGDAAISVNPYNVEEIAEAIKKVLSDEEFQQEMRQKGLERAKLFSWKKTAKETIKVYEELGESS